VRDPPTRQDLLAALGRAGCGGPPEVDLLLRTGGEHRISDFLLWESAYAEVWFSDRLWPDVADPDLAEALDWFSRRERRFGGLPPTPAVSLAASGGPREEPVHAA
jgi:undecaprenyl diphosphate synthase